MKLLKNFLNLFCKDIKKDQKGSEFVFGSVDLLEYKLNKIGLNRGGPYVDFPKWLRNKKATINSKNNDDKCFQFA